MMILSPQTTVTVKETHPKVDASTSPQGKPEDTKHAVSQTKELEDNFFRWPDLTRGCSFKNKDLRESTHDNYVTIKKEHSQIYDMIKGTKKGKLIWISNIACPGQSTGCTEDDQITKCRTNSDKDKTNMEQLLKTIGFEFGGKDQLKNATGEEIKKFVKTKLEEVDREEKNVQYNSLVVMIMSGHVDCQVGKIYDKDGKMVEKLEIYDIIRESHHFQQKPKIVIIQSYKFKEDPLYDTTDASANEILMEEDPNNEDLFVVSTYPRIEQGPWMIGNNMSGSYFIQAMIYVFKHHSYNKSFLELLKEVHKCLQTALVPARKDDGTYDVNGKPTRVADVVLLKHSKEKELFFFPGFNPKNEFNSSVRGGPVTQPVDEPVTSRKSSQLSLDKPVMQNSLNCDTEQIVAKKSDTVPPDVQAVTQLTGNTEALPSNDTKPLLDEPVLEISSELNTEKIIPQTSQKSDTVPPGDLPVTRLSGNTTIELPKDTKFGLDA